MLIDAVVERAAMLQLYGNSASFDSAAGYG